MDIVQKLASRPYDVLNTEEARKECEGNPYSLLHVHSQGSNLGLLHCRRIPYQLSYQGSPSDTPTLLIFHHHHAELPY